MDFASRSADIFTAGFHRDQSRLFPFESKHAYEKTRQNDVKWSPSLFADRTGRIPRDRSGTEQDLEKRERAC